MQNSGTATDDIASYPFLTPAEFHAACEHFVARHATRHSSQRTGETPIAAIALDQSNGITSLRILRQLGASPRAVAAAGQGAALDDGDGVEIDEVEDHEALPLSKSAGKTTTDVIYDIALSPIYRVPVLYIGFRDGNSNGGMLSADLDQAYSLLVPDVHKPALKQVGVLGGLSYGENFLTGAPALFVHPCNTSAAMLELQHDLNVTLETYLDVWLGIIGAPLGLSLPDAG